MSGIAAPRCLEPCKTICGSCSCSSLGWLGRDRLCSGIQEAPSEPALPVARSGTYRARFLRRGRCSRLAAPPHRRCPHVRPDRPHRRCPHLRPDRPHRRCPHLRPDRPHRRFPHVRPPPATAASSTSTFSCTAGGAITVGDNK